MERKYKTKKEFIEALYIDYCQFTAMEGRSISKETYKFYADHFYSKFPDITESVINHKIKNLFLLFTFENEWEEYQKDNIDIEVTKDQFNDVFHSKERTLSRDNYFKHFEEEQTSKSLPFESIDQFIDFLYNDFASDKRAATKETYLFYLSHFKTTDEEIRLRFLFSAYRYDYEVVHNREISIDKFEEIFFSAKSIEEKNLYLFGLSGIYVNSQSERSKSNEAILKELLTLVFANYKNNSKNPLTESKRSRAINHMELCIQNYIKHALALLSTDQFSEIFNHTVHSSQPVLFEDPVDLERDLEMFEYHSEGYSMVQPCPNNEEQEKDNESKIQAGLKPRGSTFITPYRLSILGKQGWELCSSIHDGTWTKYYFKRKTYGK